MDFMIRSSIAENVNFFFGKKTKEFKQEIYDIAKYLSLIHTKETYQTIVLMAFKRMLDDRRQKK